MGLAERPVARPPAALLTRYWLPVFAYLVAIQVVTMQPDFHVPPLLPNMDKLIHVLEYLGLGVLLARAFRASLPARAPLALAMAAVVLGTLVGALDELVQRFTPGRMSSVNDLLADATGLLFAQLLFLFVAREYATRP
jgi:VanZ family protein